MVGESSCFWESIVVLVWWKPHLALVEARHVWGDPGDSETPHQDPLLLLQVAAVLLLVVGHLHTTLLLSTEVLSTHPVLLPPDREVGDGPQPRQLHPGQLRTLRQTGVNPDRGIRLNIRNI